MPLSEYEQRVLAQMEQQLRTADPKLAQSMDTRTGIDIKRMSLGIGLALLGLGLLVGGAVWNQVWLGVLGFLAMLAGVMYATTGPKSVIRGKKGKQAGPKAGKPGKGSSFMDRQQDRWNKRGEGS